MDYCSAASTGVDQATNEFLHDVLHGLSQSPKTLPCKYFYDQRGCELFDAICETDEYYVTRVELEIMRRHAAEMAKVIGAHAAIFEYGSGSSVKTPLLLEQLEQPAAYIPVDIAGEHLECTVESLSLQFPELKVLPVAADFTQPFESPDIECRRKVVYFPGTTIGNFETHQARQLLENIATLGGKGGGLLIGFDLVKDIEVLEAAYNDQQGVTAEFNKNLLVRINRELNADFEIDEFTHRAIYNEKFDRIDAFLVCQNEQAVAIGEHEFSFAEGEVICTEHSHKYRLEDFDELASQANLQRRALWTDENQYFAVAFYEYKAGDS